MGKVAEHNSENITYKNPKEKINTHHFGIWKARKTHLKCDMFVKEVSPNKIANSSFSFCALKTCDYMFL